jgi:4-carboxymuconolactone decarboxylase
MSSGDAQRPAEGHSRPGGRLPLLALHDMTERQRQLYESFAPTKRLEAAKGGYLAETRGGALIGPFNSYFFVPEIADGYIAWIEAQHAHLPFSSEVREAVILTIGAAWNAPFELYAHRAVARTAGLAPETIEALATGGEPAGLSGEASLARAFTRALVTDHEVDDDLYGKAKAAFGDAGLVALTHLIGLYLSVSAVLKAFRIPAPAASMS